MMYVQSRRRKLVFALSSFFSNSFLFFSLHFPLNLTCQSNSKRKEPPHSEDPNSGASSSSTPPHGGDYEGGEEQLKGNNYEVFLSFRGKDTRKGFADHLYTGLVDAGIYVFRDNNELRVGEEFGPELLRSITQSKISIPIISKDYASSKWCLRELAHMLKCQRNGGQIVLPIFYKVEPSQLRYLTGRLGDSINAQKKNIDKMIVKKWEEALKEVTYLTGWESEKTENGHEGKLVKIIVRKVMSELKRLFLLNVPKELVGIDDRVEKIMSKIDAKFNGTWIIGIYGMGGIGKTTLAKVLYNKLSSHYEYRSFVADIRETSKRKGIECVQKQLIFSINGDSCDVTNVDDGISILKSRFTCKKVLIILDDVDDNTQLNALVEDDSWFKAGSIVIITTRDKSILDKARVSHKYQLKELLFNQSLVLFSRHAFRKDSPPSDYEVISGDIVSTSGGLPLAVEVIGSFLCGKTKEAWEDMSKKLKKVPDKKVQETLRISYDALDDEDKQIFLDIACFFIGSSKENPTYMWDACGFYPGKGIEVLSLLSLIKITEDGKLMMHDQLRDLGREIVRRENLKKPHKRSRLWEYEDVVDVLLNNKGTSKIEALRLDLYNGRGSYTADKFKELTNLRFLQVNHANLTGDFQNLLPQLRWLKWKGCHSDFEATNFHLKKLIALNLSQSGISEDWGGWSLLKMATELKVLNLLNCALRTTPDLSALKSLEILILEDCKDLEEIHPSIEDIKTLVSLNVKSCWKLKELPLGVGRLEELRELLITNTNIREIPISRGCLTKLETLDVSNCGQLARLPESLGSLVSLTKMYMHNTRIEEIPESIGSLKKLETLDASYCASLACIPSSIGDLASLSRLNLKECDKLAQLPDSIGSLVSLQDLLLSGCHSLRQIPDSIGKLTSLTELHLKSTAIEELPESIGSLKKLETLDASYCASLACIPSSIGDLASLSRLNLKECHKLAQLPDSIGSLVSLQDLLLSGCHSLRQIPYSIGKLTSLTELHLKSTAIEELPESIGSLKQLETLDASYCASLACIPSSIGDLATLSCLDLSKCHKLAHLPDSIGSLMSVSFLLLSGCHSLRQIPDSIGKLTSLTKLHLKSTAIEELPESLGSLKKLKALDASYCASLARIPSSMGDLASLSSLDLKECHKLAQLPDSIGSLVSLWRLLLSGCHSLRQIPDSIGKLTSLTELHLKSTAIEELPESLGSLKKLEILDASYCASLACIPSSIGDLASLSCLDLSECHKLAHLPDSIGSLVSLEDLLLSGCHSLRQIPDSIGKLTSLIELHLKSTAIEELSESIGSLKELKILDASCCASLACIPSSIGDLASLSCLDLSECHKLAHLPDSIGSLMSVSFLLLSGCHSLRQIPDSIGKLTSLTKLHLKSTAIEELPESLGSLKKLKALNASYCASLARIPSSMGDLASLSSLKLKECHKLAQLPDSIGSLVSLWRLLLSGCHLLRQIPDSIGKLTSLIQLHLKSTAIEELPESIGSLMKLKILDASYCASLACIPSSIGNLASLSCLDLSECHKLAHLPDSIGSLVSLWCLLLSGCHLLRQIPDSIGKLTSLIQLHLKSTAIEELPESIGSLKKLETLDASYCASLACIPSSIGDLASLSCLDLSECHKLAHLPDSIGSLVSLEDLLLSGCHSLRQIPDSIGKLTSLTKLHLKSTAIEELPESLGSLKKLKALNASYCVSLARIPSSMGDLASLSSLKLKECHKLAQLPDSIGSLVSLWRLLLSGCHLLRQIPDSIGKLTSLIKLHLKSTAIEELPESIGSLMKLKILDASYCASLACIPSSIGDLASLSCLDLSECHKLAHLPNSIGSLVSLEDLLLSGCHSLRQIPDSIGKLTSLTELHLKSTAIMELPESIGNMQNLRMLDISGTPMLELLDDRGILAELQGLRVSGWNNLEGLPNNTGQLVSPNNLDLDKLKKLSARVLALVLLKRLRTTPANNSAMDYQTTDSEHDLKRSRPFGILDKVNNLPVNILPVTFNSQSDGQSSYSSDDLPRNVVITLNQGSPVKSTDFHPVQQIMLLVGTNTGDVMVWEVGSGAMIAVRKFKVWDLGTCSMALQASLANDYTASVNRVMWSPDGTLFGVAYSKHLVHIYSYHGGDDIRNHLELEAHVGSVNDLAFSYTNKQLCVVTCGEDRSIKVWDAVTGAKQQTFESHEAPVYSICPHHKENIQFIFSTATDGKIKTWFYDNMRSRVDYDAPGHSSTMMAYSTDGTRLFSCGTNKEGESYLVEWNESQGFVKRMYHGLGKKSGGVVQFDTTKNRFLAAGDEFMVKFWDMDDNNLLMSTDADGGLPASPCITFNKEGILLAVSTSDNNIKILANADGVRMLRTVENRPFDASRVTPGPLMKPPAIATFGSGNATVGASLRDRGAPVVAMVGMNSESMADVKPRIADESRDKSLIWKLIEINEPSQCRSIRLPDKSTAMKVSRLIYRNSGCAILALPSNAVHKLWRWRGRATTSVVPQLWRPPSGVLMTNDISDTNPEDAVPCFALSKNDYYLMSASGGKISLFNMMSFKTMTKCSPSPLTTIKMEDFAVQFYSDQVDEFKTSLKGRQRGFAFQTVLVSSGADSQKMITIGPRLLPATFLAFYPRDNNILAIGMEDSSIHIYNAQVDVYKAKLKGHQKRITGLAFSNVLNVLVSSGADSQLCVWSTDGWAKKDSKVLQMPTGRGRAPLADTHVQFHLDQIHLLVVHETQIAIYKARKLECLKQWVNHEASGPITHATYSCDGQSIYVSFEDGSIGVLTASTLSLRCRINPAAYIPPNPRLRVYPLVIAANPYEPNQFALGLTDGSVHVLEPLESEGKWGTSPVESGAGPSTSSGATGSDQPQR